MRFPCNLRVASALTLAILAASSVTAQGRNATILGSFQPNDVFNDVWGYVDPATGDEYALLFSEQGTFIVDASNPAAPTQTGFISRSASGWRSSIWRDGRTYGQYLYVVQERSGGMQIIDLGNPQSPQLVTTITRSGWGNTHNISIDKEAGLLFACGIGGLGTLVYDVAANPTNPPEIGVYSAQYVHDMQMQDGFAHLAEINRDRYNIATESNGVLTSVGVLNNVPVCHNAWPTRDNDYSVLTSETSDYGMTFVDITNKSSPQRLGTWKTGGSGAIVHNAFIRDRVLHVSYYSEGYQSLDISDPTNPVRVAYHDNSSYTSGYHGAWGCYPFQPSGNIYISDIEQGLFIFESKSSTELYGNATPGNAQPTIHTTGAAFLGNLNYGLEVDDAAPSAQCFFIVSTARASQTILGVDVNVDLNSQLTLSTTTDSDGHASVSTPVPNVAAFAGVQLHCQAIVVDGGGPSGLSATRGLTLEFFAP